MLKKFFQISISIALLFTLIQTAHAQVQAPLEEYLIGSVTEIQDQIEEDETGYIDEFQEVEIEILNSSQKGESISLYHGLGAALSESEKVEVGDEVIIMKTGGLEAPSYYISDYYRIPSLIWVLGFFVVLIYAFARKKGLFSLLGLAFSILILVKFIVPQIIAGASPFLITLIGALLIILVAMYLAHGFSARTTIALISTMITILLALILSVVFVELAQVFGTGSEDAYSLQFLGGIDTLNLRGLFLGGVVIGTLGVLDDITVSQATVVHELKKANKKLSLKKLYTHAINVGQEHIASLVNTLVLAYAGAALPIFIMLSLNDSQPILMFLNSEFVAEELIRTIVGSSALVLAVPITTLMAAMYFDTHPPSKNSPSGHTH